MRSKMFRNNTLLFMFLLGWNLLPAQSVSLDEISEGMGTFQKHYVYPSVLRAIGGQQNESFNSMIQDLRFVRILRLDSAYVVENDSLINTCIPKIEIEGFEAIGTMYEKGVENSLFALEQNDRILGFIMYRKEKFDILIVEIVGDLHLNRLTDLMNMDFENLAVFFEE